MNNLDFKKRKTRNQKKLGLDLPIFYINISNLSVSDTLYKIQDRSHKDNLKKIGHKCGNWDVVSEYYKSILTLEKKSKKLI